MSSYEERFSRAVRESIGSREATEKAGAAGDEGPGDGVAEKRKVYISDESEAPEGAQIQVGEQGGLYYETGGGDDLQEGIMDAIGSTREEDDPSGIAERVRGLFKSHLKEAGVVTEKSQWIPYEGPQGGKGWKNIETGRRVYQEKPPGETVDPSDLSDEDIANAFGSEADPDEVRSAIEEEISGGDDGPWATTTGEAGQAMFDTIDSLGGPGDATKDAAKNALLDIGEGGEPLTEENIRDALEGLRISPPDVDDIVDAAEQHATGTADQGDGGEPDTRTRPESRVRPGESDKVPQDSPWGIGQSVELSGRHDDRLEGVSAEVVDIPPSGNPVVEADVGDGPETFQVTADEVLPADMDGGDGYDPSTATDDIYDEFPDATEQEIGEAMIEISDQLPDGFKRDWARGGASEMGYMDVDQFIEDMGGIDAAFEEATRMGPGRGEFLLEHITEGAARESEDPQAVVDAFRGALGGSEDGGGGGSELGSWEEVMDEYSDEEILDAMYEPEKRELAEEYIMGGADVLGDQWVRDMAANEGIEVSNMTSGYEAAHRLAQEADPGALNKYMYDAVDSYGIGSYGIGALDIENTIDPDKLGEKADNEESRTDGGESAQEKALRETDPFAYTQAKARDFIERQRAGANEKARRYISDPSDAPEGADVQEGAQGGIYYETGGGSGDGGISGGDPPGSNGPGGGSSGGSAGAVADMMSLPEDDPTARQIGDALDGLPGDASVEDVEGALMGTDIGRMDDAVQGGFGEQVHEELFGDEPQSVGDVRREGGEDLGGAQEELSPEEVRDAGWSEEEPADPLEDIPDTFDDHSLLASMDIADAESRAALQNDEAVGRMIEQYRRISGDDGTDDESLRALAGELATKANLKARMLEARYAVAVKSALSDREDR